MSLGSDGQSVVHIGHNTGALLVPRTQAVIDQQLLVLSITGLSQVVGAIPAQVVQAPQAHVQNEDIAVTLEAVRDDLQGAEVADVDIHARDSSAGRVPGSILLQGCDTRRASEQEARQLLLHCRADHDGVWFAALVVAT